MRNLFGAPLTNSLHHSQNKPSTSLTEIFMIVTMIREMENVFKKTPKYPF